MAAARLACYLEGGSPSAAPAPTRALATLRHRSAPWRSTSPARRTSPASPAVGRRGRLLRPRRAGLDRGPRVPRDGRPAGRHRSPGDVPHPHRTVTRWKTSCSVPFRRRSAHLGAGPLRDLGRGGGARRIPGAHVHLAARRRCRRAQSPGRPTSRRWRSGSGSRVTGTKNRSRPTSTRWCPARLPAVTFEYSRTATTTATARAVWDLWRNPGCWHRGTRQWSPWRWRVISRRAPPGPWC